MSCHSHWKRLMPYQPNNNNYSSSQNISSKLIIEIDIKIAILRGIKVQLNSQTYLKLSFKFCTMPYLSVTFNSGRLNRWLHANVGIFQYDVNSLWNELKKNFVEAKAKSVIRAFQTSSLRLYYKNHWTFSVSSLQFETYKYINVWHQV